MTHLLPLNKEEFDFAIREALIGSPIPVNDDTRVVAMNFFHSLARHVNVYDRQELRAAIHQSYSHRMTYKLAEEIQAKRNLEAAAAKPPKLEVVEPTIEENKEA